MLAYGHSQFTPDKHKNTFFIIKVRKVYVNFFSSSQPNAFLRLRMGFEEDCSNSLDLISFRKKFPNKNGEQQQQNTKKSKTKEAGETGGN